MTGTLWRWVRALSGAAILVLVLRHVGTGPFGAAFRVVDAWPLGAAAGVTVLTTVCCALRWSVVSGCLGVAMPMRDAVPAYYRSQFLNTVLWGGVLGDVHRAVDHGRGIGDVGSAARAVVWERTLGQVVQVVLTAAVLLVFPSPWRPHMPLLVSGLVGAAAIAVLALRAVPRAQGSLLARAGRAAVGDPDAGLRAQRAWPVLALTSVLTVAGHVAVFLLAARTAGSTASIVRLLPLALLVLLAAGLPVNLGGWGPREGMAAWVFGSAGLGADQGVATAVVYGTLVFVASLPGAVVLLASGWRGNAHHPARTSTLVAARDGRRP